MGAQQSSAQESAPGASAPAKTCYYELLAVDRQATDDEIKKAYRRRALELHPDRNINDVQTATSRFAEIQAAYEVLSDPQERAWYDSHRDAILSGQDGTDDGAAPPTFRNVRLTSTEEILGLMRKFNATVPFDDEPTGFYGISRETFEHLALEEEAAADADGVDCPDYPTFGSSDDSYESVVRAFYTAWAGFSTRKSFSWKDKYRLSDAPDRRVRRLMEKENKRCRDDAAREFNDAVRFLVAFVRKRDPRYLPNTQTDAQRQKSMRDAAAAQAARSRAANQEKLAPYEVPEWACPRNDDQGHDLFPESDDEDQSDAEVQVLECVVCNKSFKSEKQLEAHERSKKHVKAVQQLRRQMKKEGAHLDIDEAVPSSGRDAGADGGEPGGEFPEPANPETGSVGEASEAERPDDGCSTPSTRPSSPSVHGSESGDYATRSAVEERLVSDHRRPAPADTDTDGELSAAAAQAAIDDPVPARKKGMAKAKREKKAAAQAKRNGDTHTCSTCAATFTSRSKLFTHIHDQGHAAYAPPAPAARKQTKKKSP